MGVARRSPFLVRTRLSRALGVFLLGGLLALSSVAEARPKLKIAFVVSPGIATERAGELNALRGAFERRLRISMDNSLKVSARVVDLVSEIQKNVAAAQRATRGLEDLFLPRLGPWLQADKDATYYVVGEFASFRGDTDLDWQFVERSSAGDAADASWTFRRIETVTFPANVDAPGLRRNAAEVIDAIGSYTPALLKQVAVAQTVHKKVKTSCFISGEDLRRLLASGEQTEFGTDFERERSEFLTGLLPLLPSLLASALKQHGLEKEGHRIEGTNLPEVREKCMASDEVSIYHYLDTVLDDVDYLIWGFVGAISRDEIGFQPMIDLAGAERTEPLDEWKAEKWDEAIIASDLALHIMRNLRKLAGP